MVVWIFRGRKWSLQLWPWPVLYSPREFTEEKDFGHGLQCSVFAVFCSVRITLFICCWCALQVPLANVADMHIERLSELCYPRKFCGPEVSLNWVQHTGLEAVSMGETCLGEEDCPEFVLLWGSLDMSAWIMQLKCKTHIPSSAMFFNLVVTLATDRMWWFFLARWHKTGKAIACLMPSTNMRYMIETPAESDWPHRVHEIL